MKDKIIELIKKYRHKSDNYWPVVGNPKYREFFNDIKRAKLCDDIADDLERLIRDEYPEDDWREDR